MSFTYVPTYLKLPHSLNIMVQNSECYLDKIVSSKQAPRAQRRVNGLQFPLHPQQVIGWVAILVTSIVTFAIIVPAQAQQLRDAIWLLLLTLYLLHAAAHATAVLLDPAERQLRSLSRSAVPEFDRAVHAHVIENGRCHLCNIHTTSRHTKHCSICNKCVDGFDHHCKWLNHCIGKRNYIPFFLSVSTATVICSTTGVVCLCDIVFYFVSPQLLSIDGTAIGHNDTTSTIHYYEYDATGWTFFCVLCAFGLTVIIISCVLMHLCTFHIYISVLGVSTYEYIIKNSEPEEGDNEKEHKHGCGLTPFRCRSNIYHADSEKHNCLYGNKNKWHKNKVGNIITISSDAYNNLETLEIPASLQNREVRGIIQNSTINEANNATRLMTIVKKNVYSKKSSCFRPKQVSPGDQTAQATGELVTNLPSNILEDKEELPEIRQEVVPR